jgi:hypothetical protein
VRINYQRISLRHNLTRKSRKIVKFMSITHREGRFWNCPRIATAISREKRKLLPHRPRVFSLSWNLRNATALWQFNARSDGNLGVVVLLRRRSEGGMNSSVTENSSVIKLCKIIRSFICTLYNHIFVGKYRFLELA